MIKGYLLHNTVLVSAVSQHESAIVRMCPLPLEPSPAPLPIHPSRWSRSSGLSSLPHTADSPGCLFHTRWCVRFHAPLSICPTCSFSKVLYYCGWVWVSPLAVQGSALDKSVFSYLSGFTCRFHLHPDPSLRPLPSAPRVRWQGRPTTLQLNLRPLEAA